MANNICPFCGKDYDLVYDENNKPIKGVVVCDNLACYIFMKPIPVEIVEYLNCLKNINTALVLAKSYLEAVMMFRTHMVNKFANGTNLDYKIMISTIEPIIKDGLLQIEATQNGEVVNFAKVGDQVVDK